MTDQEIREANRKRAAEAAPATLSKPGVGPAKTASDAWKRACGPDASRGLIDDATGADLDGSHPITDPNILQPKLRFLFELYATPREGVKDAEQQSEFDVRLAAKCPRLSEQFQLRDAKTGKPLYRVGGGGPDGIGTPRHVDVQLFAVLELTNKIHVREAIAKLPPHLCGAEGCFEIHAPQGESTGLVARSEAELALSYGTLEAHVSKWQETSGYKPAGPSGKEAPSAGGSDATGGKGRI